MNPPVYGRISTAPSTRSASNTGRPAAPVQVVGGVAWLPLYGDDGSITYLAADRAVRVALTVPQGTSTGPWQQMSQLIGSTLPVREICVDGQLVPPDGGG